MAPPRPPPLAMPAALPRRRPGSWLLTHALAIISERLAVEVTPSGVFSAAASPVAASRGRLRPSGTEMGGGRVGGLMAASLAGACGRRRFALRAFASVLSFAASAPLLISVFSLGLKYCHRDMPSGGAHIWPESMMILIAAARFSFMVGFFLARIRKRSARAFVVQLQPIAAAVSSEQSFIGHCVSSEATMSSATILHGRCCAMLLARSHKTVSSTSASCALEITCSERRKVSTKAMLHCLKSRLRGQLPTASRQRRPAGGGRAGRRAAEPQRFCAAHRRGESGPFEVVSRPGVHTSFHT
mmetsp:Transcript_32484/g.85277  ORF Transcript_32484/g.85277 Transcript_32484/m.85277 type:complete len:300 (+) Transcript_32484:2604-3503(+)